MKPNRIAIVGGSGTGKTTLGKRLAEVIDGSLVEVDALQHKAHWTKASAEEIRSAVYAARRQSISPASSILGTCANPGGFLDCRDLVRSLCRPRFGRGTSAADALSAQTPHAHALGSG